MVFEVTEAARRATEGAVKEPLLILEIEGLTTILSSKTAFKYAKYGDPGLVYGLPGLVYGGKIPIEDQEGIISFSTGTTTSISQQLEIDKGRGSSVSSIQVSLVDVRGYASKLISPGVILNEILGKKCRLWFGFEGTAYPDDFIILFRGNVDDVNSAAGTVNINVAHPDQKKRQKIFNIGESVLDGGIDASQTTITVESTSKFLSPVLGPDGLNDSTLKFYIRIDDEIIRYTSKTATQFLGCSRGQLNTTPASHGDGANVTSFYRIEGNCIDIALKLLLSGVNGNFAEDIKIDLFNRQTPTDVLDNSVLVKNIDLEKIYNIQIGDYVTINNSPQAPNNVNLKRIKNIIRNSFGTVLEIDGVSFVDDNSGLARMAFRSQFDTLGEGLGFSPDEVDIKQHLDIKSNFLSSFNYDFYLKEDIDGKEFLEKEVYLPAGCYSLPRKSQASLGILAPPRPGEEITVFDNTNVFNASKIRIRRATTKNFLNTIVYKYDELPLEDKFVRALVTTDVDSRNRIKNQGNKTLLIESKGMRRSLNAEQLADVSSRRRLDQYKFAAEFFEGVQVNFGDSYRLEIGDIVILDGSKLNITDFSTGTRDKKPVLVQIINKSINIRTGEVKLDLLNTGYDLEDVKRYCLQSPASKIKSFINSQSFVLDPSFSNPFGNDEGRKWRSYTNLKVIIRKVDYSVFESATVSSISLNTVTLQSPLTISLVGDFIMELDVYNNVTSDVLKLKYGWMTDSPTFADGRDQYTMS
jgi:hypothetical protein